MKILRALVLPTLVFALATGCGKKGSADTSTPPGETAGDSGEAGPSETGDSGEADSGTAQSDTDGETASQDGGKLDCPAETADVPTPLWADSVLVRMPVGVEMVERNEVFAQASGEAESTCGAMVTRAAMGYFQDDTAKKITQLRDETLTQIGFDVSTLTWSNETEKGRNFTGAYEAPADDQGNPPVKGWFQFKEHQGNLFWLILEAHPNAFDAIQPSFKKSGESLIFVQ